jgi:hypothetical protein
MIGSQAKVCYCCAMVPFAELQLSTGTHGLDTQRRREQWFWKRDDRLE